MGILQAAFPANSRHLTNSITYTPSLDSKTTTMLFKSVLLATFASLALAAPGGGGEYDQGDYNWGKDKCYMKKYTVTRRLRPIRTTSTTRQSTRPTLTTRPRHTTRPRRRPTQPRSRTSRTRRSARPSGREITGTTMETRSGRWVFLKHFEPSC